MAPRVLVCIEDTGVAHVVAARLMRDGVDGVVVDRPASLVEEARRGVSAVAVQDKYPSGEAATSLLRQIRVARSEAVPAILLVTGEMPQSERHVLEKQYRVRDFLPVAASPLKIADALKAAATGDEELVLHEDERKNEFDISVDSVASKLDAGFDGAFGGGDLELKTVEVSAEDLKRMRLDQLADGVADALKVPPPTSSDDEPVVEPRATPQTNPRITPRLAPQPVTQEGGAQAGNGASVTLTIEGMNPASDLSQLPAPGGDMDLDFSPRPTTRAPAPSPISAVAPEPFPQTPRPPEGDEGDALQIQELQKTQNELKKALLAERKKTEAAQKRVEELEAKLARGGEPKERTATTGVPADGVFEDLRYPALLARCRSDAYTGAIQMQSGGAVRTVFLRDGLPVAFHSSEPGERIGRVLVEQKRISEDQYQRATVRSVERSTKLTDALVELGYMDAETIAVELRNLTRDQIIAHFEMVQGRFTTQAGSTPDAQTATFDFGPGEIYVQGYRRYAPANEMLAAYETMRDKYLIANARLAGYRPKLGLNGEDERLIRLLGEALTVEEAVDRAQVSPDAASRLISALQALELVEEWSPGVEQFRSRIRYERQRHAEEIAGLHSDARRREDRLIESFEGALKKLGVNLSLAASADSEPKRDAKPTTTTASPAVNAFAPGGGSSTASLGFNSSAGASASPGSAPPAAVGATGSAAGAKPPLSSTTVGGGSNASPSASPAAASTPAPTPTSSGPSASASSSGASLSVADLKYREGVDQATQNRLDEAEVTLREAVRLDASKPEYLTSLARVLLANPRYERSGTLPVVRSLLDRAVQIAPDFQEAVDLHQQVIREMST